VVDDVFSDAPQAASYASSSFYREQLLLLGFDKKNINKRATINNNKQSRFVIAIIKCMSLPQIGRPSTLI